MEETEITPALLAKEQNAQSISFQAFRREEEYWRLKSRGTWMKAGDNNTSFFHKQCRVRISQNHILEINSQSGEVVKGNSQIKQLAEFHFQNLFKEDALSDPDLTSDFLANIPSLVSEAENDELMNPFKEKEIIDVIWSMELDKAPRPDRLSFLFYRICWPVIRKDLL